jgi:hypothetical protein
MNVVYKQVNKYSDKDIELLGQSMGINSNNKELIKREVSKKIMDETNDKCYYFKKKLSSDCLKNIRSKIYNEHIKFKNSVTKMTSYDLYKIFKSYDNHCFNGDIQQFLKQNNYSLKFKTNGQETFTTEGYCIFNSCNYVITIPVDKFKYVNGITNVAGDNCKDQLECLQRVIEHEIIHLIIFIFCRNIKVSDQHGSLFMSFVQDIFHHTDHRHYIF